MIETVIAAGAHMRVSFNGDVPSSFVAAWLALWAAWVILRLAVDRSTITALTSKRASVGESERGWSPTPFILSAYEKTIFGLRQHEDVVTFGPSGRQTAGAVVVPSLAALVAAIVLESRASSRVEALFVTVALIGFVYGLAGLRVRVWPSLDALTLRGRFTRTMRLPWDEVEDVTTQAWLARIQQRGGSTNAVVGVVQLPNRAPLAIPGFRCLAWADENSVDHEAVTYIKVAIVRRYRQSLVGYWPIEP